jgi:hypothetical protein
MPNTTPPWPKSSRISETNHGLHPKSTGMDIAAAKRRYVAFGLAWAIALTLLAFCFPRGLNVFFGNHWPLQFSFQFFGLAVFQGSAYPGQGFFVSVSPSLLFGLSGGAGLLPFLAYWRRSRRLRLRAVQRLHIRCGYDLRCTTGPRCPECGSPTNFESL